MILEILDAIGEFAGTYFLLAVNRKPTPRLLLRDGGVCKILEEVLETGGDIQMLYSIREMYPDSDLAIVKAVKTQNPHLVSRVCAVWNTWHSDIGYSISYQLSFTWGVNNLQTSHPMTTRVAAPVPSPTTEEFYWSGDEESEEEDLGMITSDQVPDVNSIVCEDMKAFTSQIEELREFIEINGVQHMSKIREDIPIQGPSEHAMWLINLCVDLGYQGMRCMASNRSHVEPGVIHYKYPSMYDPDIACWMYFENN